MDSVKCFQRYSEKTEAKISLYFYVFGAIFYICLLLLLLNYFLFLLYSVREVWFCDSSHWEALGWEESCSPTPDGLSLGNPTMAFTISSLNSKNCQDRIPALNSSHLWEAAQKEWITSTLILQVAVFIPWSMKYLDIWGEGCEGRLASKQNLKYIPRVHRISFQNFRSNAACYGMNICMPQNSYVETLTP